MGTNLNTLDDQLSCDAPSAVVGMRSQDPHVVELLNVRVLVEYFLRWAGLICSLQQDSLDFGESS